MLLSLILLLELAISTRDPVKHIFHNKNGTSSSKQVYQLHIKNPLQADDFSS